MNKGLKKAIAFGLCAGLAVTSITGCSKKASKFDAEATALTVNGNTLPVGVINLAVRDMQVLYENLYMQFGVSDPFNQDLSGAGTTLGDDVKESVVDELTRAMLAEEHMGDYGVEISEEDKAKVTDAAAQFMADNDASLMEEIGITQANVERYLELYMIQKKVEVQMCADVDTEVSDEEAAQRSIDYVLFNPMTEEEMLAAQEAESELESESEFSTEAQSEEEATLEEEETNRTQSADETEGIEMIEEETEDPEAQAAMVRAYDQAAQMIEKVEAGEDFYKAAEKMGKTASVMTFGSDYTVTGLVEATDGLEENTLVPMPVEDPGNGYYVVRLISQLDREATDEKKEEIVEQRKEDRVNELYDEWTEAGEITVDEDVMATIIFDYHLTQPVEEEAVEEGSETEE